MKIYKKLMNLDIFRQKDKSGKYSKEKWVMDNYAEEWKYVSDWADNLDLSKIRFSEKVYLCLNGLVNIPKCANVNCSQQCNFLSLNRGYTKYCSNSCISSDPSLKEQKQIKSLQKWGITHPQKLDIIKQKAKQTNLERYGTHSPILNERIKLKSKQTLFENYGVENPSNSEIISSFFTD